MSNYYKELELFEKFKSITDRYAKSLSEKKSGCFHHKFETVLDECLNVHNNKIAFTNKALDHINKLDFNNDIKTFLHSSTKNRLLPNEHTPIEVPESLEQVLKGNSKYDESIIEGYKNYLNRPNDMYTYIIKRRSNSYLTKEYNLSPKQEIYLINNFNPVLQINTITINEIRKTLNEKKLSFIKTHQIIYDHQLFIDDDNLYFLIDSIENFLEAFSNRKASIWLMKNDLYFFELYAIGDSSNARTLLVTDKNEIQLQSYFKNILKCIDELKQNESKETNNKLGTANIEKNNNAIIELKKVWLPEPKLPIDNFLKKCISKGICNEKYELLGKRNSMYSTGKNCLSALANAFLGHSIPNNINHNKLGEAFCNAFNVKTKTTTKNPYKTFSKPDWNILREIKREFNIRN